MFVVTNRIPVAPGHEKEFEDRFRNRARLVDSSPGFIRNLVMRPVQRRPDRETGAMKEIPEPGCYLIQTYWESERAFLDWTQSEAFREAHRDRPSAGIFSGPSVLEIHEVVQRTDREENPGG